MRMVVVGVHKDGSKVLAKEACPRCYGRGYIGHVSRMRWQGRHRELVPDGVQRCSCLVRVSAPKQPTWWERFKAWVKSMIGAGEARKSSRASVAPT